jgi:hypothetical protein
VWDKGEWEAWKRVPVRVRAQVAGPVCFFVGRIITVNEAGRRAELSRASASDRIELAHDMSSGDECVRVVCVHACVHGFTAAVDRVCDRQMPCVALGGLGALHAGSCILIYLRWRQRGQGRWAARLDLLPSFLPRRARWHGPHGHTRIRGSIEGKRTDMTLN